mmetsp:Transcript_107193/g.309990  ORF Transcript_107193/g.309990 Transcript_107193/m.309990 type:complete len:215 (+) Transcript_107193:1286-1930(+)
MRMGGGAERRASAVAHRCRRSSRAAVARTSRPACCCRAGCIQGEGCASSACGSSTCAVPQALSGWLLATSFLATARRICMFPSFRIAAPNAAPGARWYRVAWPPFPRICKVARCAAPWAGSRPRWHGGASGAPSRTIRDSSLVALALGGSAPCRRLHRDMGRRLHGGLSSRGAAPQAQRSMYLRASSEGTGPNSRCLPLALCCMRDERARARQL